MRHLIGSGMALVVLTCACRGNHPIELSEIATTDTAGWAHDIILEKDTLYLSDRQGGFLMFQRAPDWGRPKVFHPVTDVISLAPNSGMPVLASRFEGLVLVSADGHVLARYANGDIANAVVTRGDFAFAAYGLHGMVVARLTRGSIDVLAELSSPGWSHDIKLSREQAFVADWNYGLRVVDIHDPAHPAETAVLPSPATSIAVSIRESGGKRVAAIADGHAGVALANLDASGRPRFVGRNQLGLRTTDQPHPESGGWAHSVAWGGTHLFVANWKRGLTVLDAADLSNPRVEREIPTNGTALGVRTEEQPDGSWLIFLADGEAGLKVYRFRE